MSDLAERRRLILEILPELVDNPGGMEFLLHMPEVKAAIASYEQQTAEAKRRERLALKKLYEAAGYRLPEPKP